MSRGVELIGVVAAHNLQCASIFNNLTALRQLFLTHTHTLIKISSMYNENALFSFDVVNKKFR